MGQRLNMNLEANIAWIINYFMGSSQNILNTYKFLQIVENTRAEPC